MLSGPIWVRTVCKVYQQTKLVGKDLFKKKKTMDTCFLTLFRDNRARMAKIREGHHARVHDMSKSKVTIRNDSP